VPPLSTGYNRRPVYRKKPSRRAPAPVYHAPAPVYHAPVYRPTRTQIRSSQAQARQYGSQSRQIQKEAERQRKKVRLVRRQERQAARAVRRFQQRGFGGASDIAGYRAQQVAAQRARGFGGASDIQRRAAQRTSAAQRRGFGSSADYYRKHPSASRSTIVRGKDIGLKGTAANRVYSPSEAASALAPLSAQHNRRDLASIISKYGPAAGKQSLAERKSRNLAPTLKVIDFLQRPEYAVGGAIHGAKSGNLSKTVSEAGKGLKGQTKHTPGKEIVGEGKGALKGIARFGLDVGLDPLTYTGLGLESAAGKGALKASEQAYRQAMRASLKGARSAIRRDVERGAYARGSKTWVKAQRRAVRDARSKGRVVGRRVHEAHVDKAERAGPVRRGVTVQVAGAKTARKTGRIVRAKVLPRKLEKAARKRTPVAPLVRSSRAFSDAQRAGFRQIGNTRLARKLTKGTGPEVGEAIRGVAANVHGNVRPVRLSRAEHVGTMGIKREARGARGVLERRAVERGDALFRKLNGEEKRQVIDALESGRSRHLSQKLRDVVGHYRGEQRFQRRLERRSASLSGEVGTQSKSRGEVALGARTRQITEKDIDRARQNVKRSTDNVRHLEQQYWRRHEDPEFTHKSWDPERKKLIAQIEEAKKAREKARQSFREVFPLAEQRAANKAELKTMRRERLQGQAKGYFSRVPKEEIEARSALVQRLRQGPEPDRKMVTASKPKPGSSKRREHREPIAAMREGDKTQQLRAERISEDLSKVMVERGREGAKGVQAAIVNRKLADEFGRKVPRNFDADTFRALADKGEHVYRLEGSDLVRLNKTEDIEEIKRAALSPRERAAADITTHQQRRYAEAENLKPPAKPSTGAARYVVLRDDVAKAARARESTIGSGQPALEFFDAAQRGFKTLALGTPSYLVRNFAGDMFNAWTEQQATKLVWNLGRGQRVLQAAGKEERALGRRNLQKGQKSLQELGRFQKDANKLKRILSPGQREIKLKPEQARELAPSIADNLYQVVKRGNPDLSKAQIRAQVEERLSSGKVPAIALAHMAERMGVIRQGRFTELMDEGGFAAKKFGGKGWSNTVKRVEDSHRIATFLGGLQRGLSAREAAQVATDVHFDYGALTPFEKGVMRRAMPFYTFPSRNIPLQAKQILRRPGKYLTLEKAREEFANQAGLKPGWEQNLNPFEALQMPIPIVAGKNKDGSPKIVTVSLGQPFTDLNDVTKTAEGVTAIPRALAGMDTQGDLLKLSTPLRRGLEQLGPWKTPIEILANTSLFYHEPIAPDRRTLTQAPQWAIALSKVPELGPLVAHNTRLHKVRDGSGKYMWDKRAAYLMRSFGPGIVGAVGTLAGAVPGIPQIGVQGTNERGRTERQRQLGVFGPRVVPYEPEGAKANARYDRLSRLEKRLNEIRQTYGAAGTDYHGKRDYERAMKRWRVAKERVAQVAPVKPGQEKKKKPSSPRVSSGGGSEIGLLP
jgi:hypothetical protein